MAIGKVIINGQRYTADCTGGATDPRWGGRRVRDIRMTESYETMQQLFPAGGMVEWATVNPHVELRLRVDEHGEPILDESGKPIYDEIESERIVSMEEWPLCGAITDNRDGSFTARVGTRLTREVEAERDEALAALQIIMEGE